jgi:hypothetical protein
MHLARQLRNAIFRVSFWSSPQTNHDGITLVCAVDQTVTADEFFEKARAALRLIASTSPTQYRWVRRYLKRIAIVYTGGGVYDTELNTYLVHLESFPGRTITSVACGIIHEATHGRICASGIPYRDGLQKRIEEVCVRQEVAFLRLLPGGEELVAGKEEALRREWWKPEAMEARTLHELHHVGMRDRSARLLLRALRWLRLR